MLFDPLEEQFNFPSILIQFCYRRRCDLSIVCQKYKMFTGLLIVIFDASQLIRIVAGGFDAGKLDDLIASQAAYFVDG